VVVVGVPAVAVIAFEVVLNATSMFNHSNAAMPLWLDRIVRLLVVTPDMHRVHHSIRRHETDSNFGFNLPWWDRLFGTYRSLPEAGHAHMTIGLPIFRDPAELRLDRLITQPFRDHAAATMAEAGARERREGETRRR
jgi:sterol desaturase/sphingolipid hydroxylase (fatty acid hydroxylase superfamily)